MITLTDKATQHVSRYPTHHGEDMDLRMGVKTAGCSDLAYKFEYADETATEDQVLESNGIRVIADPRSLPYVDGIELDYTCGGLNEGFRFNSLNVKDEYGYGESFRM